MIKAVLRLLTGRATLRGQRDLPLQPSPETAVCPLCGTAHILWCAAAPRDFDWSL
jgi:hypothetical protein